MANDNTVTMVLEVDSKDAQKAIEQFGASSVKSVKKTEAAVNDLKVAFGPIAAVITVAIGTVVGAFRAVSGAIDEAAKDSKGLKQIDAALRSTGEGGAEAVQAIVDYADAIKLATGLSDDLVKEAFLTAKSFGVSTEEAKKLTSAAVDLATATGVDVETAVRQLGGTIDGSIGKIGNLGAEFRNLSTEQLKAGAAIDLVASKYKGAAESGLNTYAGATSSLENAISDLLKSFGKIITESDAVISSIQTVAKAINYLAEVVPHVVNPLKDYQKQLDDAKAKKFVDQIELIGNQSLAAAPKVKSLFDNIAGGQSNAAPFETFGQSLDALVVKSVSSTQLTGKAAEDSRKKYDELAKSILTSGESEIETAGRVRDERLKLLSEFVGKGIASEKELSNSKIKILGEFTKAEKKQFDEIDKLIEEFANTAEKEAKKAGEALAKIDSLEAKGTISFAKAVQYRGKIITDFNEKRIKEAKDAAEKEAEEIKKHLGDLGTVKFTADFRATLGDSFASALEGIDLNKFAAGLGSAITTALKGGDEKARFQGIGGVISGVLTAYLGPLGAVLGDFITQLSQNNKEQTKKFIADFVDSAPDFVLAVADNLPAIFEGLIETLTRPSFWVRAAKAFMNGIIAIYGAQSIAIYNAITSAFSVGTDQVQNALLNIFAPGAKELYDGIVRAVPAMVQGLQDAFSRLGAIFDGIIQFFRDAFQPLLDAFSALQSAVTSLTEAFGKGGGKGLASEAAQNPLLQTVATGGLNKAFGFKKGGMVYAADGFVPRGTDTVPAMLTPGEMVIPTDLVGQLANFLSSQSSSGPVKSDAILMAILQAVQQPVTVQSQVSVNQNAFADIILQLNRQNLRMTA